MLDAGAHLYLQKPISVDVLEGEAILAKARQSGRVVQIGTQRRSTPHLMEAKKNIVDAGLLGRVLRFRSEMFSPTITRDVGEAGWRTSHANGGGAVFEMASHAIDLIAYFFGPPSRVGGTSLSKVFSRQVEDIVSTSLFYDAGPRAGLSGTMYVNWSDASFRKPTNKFEIFGEAGKMLVDQHGMKLHLKRASAEHGLKEGWNQLYITDVARRVPFYVRGNEYTAQLYDFIDAIRAQKEGHAAPVRCTFADATANLRVIEQIFADDAVCRSAEVAA